MEKSALIYIMLTVICVALAYPVQNKVYASAYISGRIPAGPDRIRVRNGALQVGIYLLMAGVSACRIAVGNDYWVYAENFRLIAQGRYVSSEPGFNLVVKWMQLLFGYDRYLPVFALFSCLTVFLFLKALHDQAVWYSFSLFLLLTGGYYFSSLNSVRYYLALSAALFSMKYVLRGDYVRFLCLIGGAALFHKSVLLVIPVYLLARLLSEIEWKPLYTGLAAGFAVSLSLGQDIYRRIIFYFYPFYENSDFDRGEISWINIGKCAAVLLVCLVCGRRSLQRGSAGRFYFVLNLMGLATYTFGSFIPEVSRVGYYMIVSQVLLLPGVLWEKEEDRLREGIRRFALAGSAAGFAAYFAMFLLRAYDVSNRLLPYRNWIFD